MDFFFGIEVLKWLIKRGIIVEEFDLEDKWVKCVELLVEG